jgi:hypothetical protein
MTDLSFAGIRVYVDALARDVEAGRFEGYELLEQYVGVDTVMVELEGHWRVSPFKEVHLTYATNGDTLVLVEYVVKGWCQL